MELSREEVTIKSMENTPPNFPGIFGEHLRGRGRSEAYARKMERVTRRFFADPLGKLEKLAPTVTQATISDLVNRLRIFGGWMREKYPERANPWLELPRLEAGRRAVDRACFDMGHVKALLSCERLPAHRRAFYRVQATLGLRPKEAGSLRAEHLVRCGNEFVVRLPGSTQKSGREDQLSITRKERDAIAANLPLLREPLGHYERTFALDMAYAGIDAVSEGVNRRLYDLRSFYITSLFASMKDANGPDLETIRILARHANIETTLRHYVRHKQSTAGAARAQTFHRVA